MIPASQARLRLIALLFIGILLQTTLVPDVRIRGVCPDLMLLAAVCAGLVSGAEYGAAVGFAAGLLTDLFLPTTPFGLSALAYCVTGFATGAVRSSMLREGRVMAPLVSFIASAGGVILFVVAGVMVGQSQLTLGGLATIAKTAALVGAMNALLAIPGSRMAVWVASGAAMSSTARPVRNDRSTLGR